MDTTFKSTFNIHIDNHTFVNFLKCGPGLYYFDTTNFNKSLVKAYSFLSTITDKKSCFCRREIEGVDRACDLQGKFGWPSIQYYQNIITNNQIINTKVTFGDINRAEYIYGPRVAILKEKMLRKIPQCVQNVPRVQLPSPILDHHKTEELGVNLMFVNGHVFLVTT